ncbi:MAG TPA: carboxypeptidase-like regulatory domain-containing protein, partial [Candidatus Solibacter sp.]|nr:carboxypeptidase-like regulatory domain-containing protein [Candidatus Solibacter sp.]
MSFKTDLFAAAFLSTLWLVTAPYSLGQAVATVQISGVAQDASGAVVPGVAITATQTATGVNRRVVTDSGGNYVMAQLPIGPYQLTAEKAGFKTYVQKGIVIQVGENPTINVTLEVGAVGQSVEVTANTVMIETQETSQSTVIDQARITELPLNGRQATQLIVLAGGAVPSRNGNLATSKNYPTSVTLSVSGGQGDGTNYILDGGDHNDAFSNVNQPFPFPDALQEFSVQTSTLSARYGLHPGATVNAVTKSGTNQFHGNVFEFLRNGSLNARNFFAATHDTLKRNQFGGTFGGPLRKEKLFFFGGYQGTRNRQAPPQSLALLPTLAALNGDFSVMDSAGCQSSGRGKTLIDPMTGAAFPSNFIPPSRFSAPAVTLVTKYLPAPGDGCGNLRYGIPVTGDEDQYVGKVDWVQTAKHSLFGRYFITDYSDPAVFGGSNALTAAKPGVVDRAQSLVIGDTYSITSRVVNGLHARASRTRVNRGEPSNMISPKTLGVNINPLVPNHIDMTVSGAFTLGCGTCAPAHFMTNSYQIADDVDAVIGHHQLSFGGQIIRNQLNWLAHTLSNGQMTINGQSTGDSLADLMLGRVSSFQKGGPLATWWRQIAMGLYMHDVWRVAPNLTVNLGLRWEPFIPESDIYAQGVHFDLASFLAGKKSSVYSNAPPGFFYYGDPDMPKGSTYRSLADFEPR